MGLEFDMREAFELMNATMFRLRLSEPVIKKAGEIGQHSVKHRIATTKSAPDGPSWAEWSPLTAAGRAKRGTAARGLLFDSGSLLDSIGAKQTALGVEIAPTVKYGQFLQDGTQKMPARPFMGWDHDTIAQVETLFQAWVNGGKL